MRDKIYRNAMKCIRNRLLTIAAVQGIFFVGGGGGEIQKLNAAHCTSPPQTR